MKVIVMLSRRVSQKVIRTT